MPSDAGGESLNAQHAPESHHETGLVGIWAMIGFGMGLICVIVASRTRGDGPDAAMLPWEMAAVTLVLAAAIGGRYGALGALAGIATSALIFVGCWGALL